jgi:hypothetical protein
MAIILSGPILILPFVILLIRSLISGLFGKLKKNKEIRPVETDEIFDHLFIKVNKSSLYIRKINKAA